MKKELNKVGGQTGEVIACNYLKKKKYKILEMNCRNRLGEIDIIAGHKKTIIFVEVKSRSTLAFGRPSEAVDMRKQNKIRGASQLYLIQNKLTENQCQFDVIEILDDEVINHIENAF